MTHRIALHDEAGTFTVTLVEPPRPERLVLFAVGAGGDPARHMPLLAALAGIGSLVVAPHFDRLASPAPTDEELRLRGGRLALASRHAAAGAGAGLPLAGVGHSIGATMLLALAGARVWTRREAPLVVAADVRLERLALLTPATGFFQAPGALDDVRVPVAVWAGGADTITPPDQAAFLERALGARVPVRLRVLAEAGHFSFMDVLPPDRTDPVADREAFLAGLHADVCSVVEASEMERFEPFVLSKRTAISNNL